MSDDDEPEMSTWARDVIAAFAPDQKVRWVSNPARMKIKGLLALILAFILGAALQVPVLLANPGDVVPVMIGLVFGGIVLFGSALYFTSLRRRRTFHVLTDQMAILIVPTFVADNKTCAYPIGPNSYFETVGKARGTDLEFISPDFPPPEDGSVPRIIFHSVSDPDGLRAELRRIIRRNIFIATEMARSERPSHEQAH